MWHGNSQTNASWKIRWRDFISEVVLMLQTDSYTSIFLPLVSLCCIRKVIRLFKHPHRESCEIYHIYIYISVKYLILSACVFHWQMQWLVLSTGPNFSLGIPTHSRACTSTALINIIFTNQNNFNSLGNDPWNTIYNIPFSIFLASSTNSEKICI